LPLFLVFAQLFFCDGQSVILCQRILAFLVRKIFIISRASLHLTTASSLISSRVFPPGALDAHPSIFKAGFAQASRLRPQWTPGAALYTVERGSVRLPFPSCRALLIFPPPNFSL
jgi:hypothetical protein